MKLVRSAFRPRESVTKACRVSDPLSKQYSALIRTTSHSFDVLGYWRNHVAAAGAGKCKIHASVCGMQISASVAITVRSTGNDVFSSEKSVIKFMTLVSYTSLLLLWRGGDGNDIPGNPS